MDEATNQFGDGKSMIIWVLMEVVLMEAMIVARSRKRKWGTVNAILMRLFRSYRLGLSLILPYVAVRGHSKTDRPSDNPLMLRG